jgi:hypothetical protein
MSSYIIRNLDPDLRPRCRDRATAEGLPLSRVILALLALYADGRVTVTQSIIAKAK